MGRNISLASVLSGASPETVIAQAPVSIRNDRQFRRSLHVLTLTPFYPVAEDDGRGCFVAESIPALAEAGIKNTVVAVQAFYRGRAVASDSSFSAKWVRYFALAGNCGLPTSGAFLFLRILAQVRRLHRAHPLDLIHAHAALPCGHVAALLSRELGIPYLVTVHGLDAYALNQSGRLAGRWCKHVSAAVYRSASRVICVSEKVREQVLEAHAKATVVYNGVDSVRFAPAAERVASARILSVGDLIPIKGHELLLWAIAAIRDRWPQVECDIVGDGPQRANLESLAGRLGVRERVHFVGRQSRRQVALAMRSCTIFALPSRYEGLGCVYLEAMSSARPVIACRGQGIEGVIQHGINGWLTAPGDVDLLAEAICLLLGSDSLRQKLGNAARRTILNGFTLVHQAERLSQVYRECVA